MNGRQLYTKGPIYIEDDNYNNFEIVETKRIGIDYAEEAKDFYGDFILKIIFMYLKSKEYIIC